MRADLAALGDDFRPRLERSVAAWGDAAALGASLRDRIEKAKTSWLVASPLEPLAAYPVAHERDYRVVAVDGSQVFPDRHEIGHCYLVNAGVVDIDYRTGKASLRSVPELAYRPEDMYPSFGGMRQEVDGRVVGAHRFAAECDALTAKLDEPLLALVDGTLLLWWLEPDPDRLRALPPGDVKALTLGALSRLFERARATGTALASYLSSPRTTDVVSMVKVVLCTEDPVDCDRCPYASGAKTWVALSRSRGLLPDPSKPCEEAETVTDAALFGELLASGERSPRFRSAARVTHAYPCPVDFVYLHTGAEIARLEFPAWTTPGALEWLVGAVADQCAKGMGYPVALSEAHEQAVVRWSDRRAFVDLVQRGGMSQVSAKLARKRTSVL